jgi:hypothetical protein
VAQQNLISGVAATSANVSVQYGGGSAGATNTSCTGAGAAFGVNPVVTVTVTSGKLPIFFARVFTLFPRGNFSNTTAVATATAEVFNSSNSASVAGSMIPVQPRCVKPLVIPNKDPGNPGAAFVSTVDGSIQNPGVLGGKVIGETFNLAADCTPGGFNCHGRNMPDNPPKLNGTNLDYVPALVSGNPSAAPSCANANTFQEAIGGCDQSTVYTCGTPSGTSGATQLDLNENPVNPGRDGGDGPAAAECLINQSSGNDSLDTTSFPFQIKAGSGSALVQSGVVSSNNIITTSNSIMTVPIFDNAGAPFPRGNHEPPVTIVGFLQVFINDVDTTNGNINVTVLNVSGCSNNASNSPVTGTSPVPIRLITSP